MLLLVLGPDSPARVVGIPEITGPRAPNTERFLEFLGNSLQLALLTAVVCVLASIFIANGSRFVSGRTTGLAARLTAVGYAVPGPVVAMGVVLSLVALDDVLEGIGLGLPGTVATGSLVGLVYAYSIRFLAPGLNAIEAGMAGCPRRSPPRLEASVLGRPRSCAGSTPPRPHERRHRRRSRRRRCTEGAADRAASSADRLQHLADLDLQPGDRVTLRTSRAACARHYRRGDDPGRLAVASAVPRGQRA